MGKAHVYRRKNPIKERAVTRSEIRRGNNPVSFYKEPTQGAPASSSQYHLKTDGGLMSGPIGFMADLITIASDDVKLYENVAGDRIKIRGDYYLAPETGSTDILNRIDSLGSEFPGQRLLLQGVSGNTITITHGIANSGDLKGINCPGDSDIELSGDDFIILRWDVVAGKWAVLSGGGGGISDPLILGSLDLGNLGSAKTVDWSLNNHQYGLLDSTNCTITMSNLSALDEYEPVILQFKQDATGGRGVTFADSFVNGGVPFIDPQPNAYTTVVFYTDGNQDIHAFSTTVQDSLAMDMSDENSSLNVASESIPFRTFWTDFAFHITNVIITCTTAPTGGGSPLTVDVRKNGTTIFTTRVSIDDDENTSETAVTPMVLDTPDLGFNDKITIFLTIRDAGNVATGLKCKLIGVKN